MLKARHTILGNALMSGYISVAVKRHFRGMQIRQKPESLDNGPILLLANHFSWWDGFTHYYLNRLYFRKRFHLMMQEEELAKRPIFRNAGVFSIKKGSREVFESLDYTVKLLTNFENLVVMFPQGRLNSLHQQQFYFEKGVMYLMKNLSKEVNVIFSIFLPEYGPHPKPILTSHLFTMPENTGESLQLLEEAFTQKYQEAVAGQIKSME